MNKKKEQPTKRMQARMQKKHPTSTQGPPTTPEGPARHRPISGRVPPPGVSLSPDRVGLARRPVLGPGSGPCLSGKERRF